VRALLTDENLRDLRQEIESRDPSYEGNWETELLAYLAGDAISGSSEIGLELLENSDQIRSLLSDYFANLSPLNPQALTDSPDVDLATTRRKGKLRSDKAKKKKAAKPRVKKLDFDDLDTFNDAANDAQPHTSYTYNGHTYTTDAAGRSATVKGKLEHKPHGRHGASLQTKIGNEGRKHDVGFHLIGDQFNGAINRLNVLMGNGKPIRGKPNLNTGSFKQIETIWRKALDAGKEVEVKLRPVYDTDSKRPDRFEISYKIGKGKWTTETLENTAGRQRGPAPKKKSSEKNSPKKKATAKKATTKKATTKKTAAKKATAKRTTTKKATAKKKPK